MNGTLRWSVTVLRARRGGAAVLLVLVSFMATALVGCTSARDTLGTNASPCFEALAIAADAVHDRGRFAGVRQLSISSFAADTHLRVEMTQLFGPSIKDVCVVSYRGDFRVDQVDRPVGPTPSGGVGHYAIVIVSKPQNHLLGTVVRATQPLRFGHPL